jgi:hypothetical protein
MREHYSSAVAFSNATACCAAYRPAATTACHVICVSNFYVFPSICCCAYAGRGSCSLANMANGSSCRECVDLTHHCIHLLFCICREGELQSAAFGANEASCHLNELRAQVEQLSAATHSAEETAAAATGAQQIGQSWPQLWQHEAPAGLQRVLAAACGAVQGHCYAVLCGSIMWYGSEMPAGVCMLSHAVLKA